MTRLDRLKEANVAVQNMALNDDLAFFSKLLPDKMSDFIELTYFDIGHEEFQNYLKEYRDTLVVSTIQWCKDSKVNETDWQKEFTLKVCKKCIDNFFSIIKIAFEHYLNGKELLLKDEDFN